MKRFHLWTIVLASVSLLNSCGLIVLQDEYSKITPGVWRGVIQLDRQPMPINKKAEPKYRDLIKFEEVTGGEVPFLMNVEYTTDDNLRIQIENDDTLLIENIYYGLDRATAYDTIRLVFNDSSSIKAVTQEGVIEGDWFMNGKPIHFVAKQGKDYRFTALRKPPTSVLSRDMLLKSVDDSYSKIKIDSIPLIIVQQKDNLLLADITILGKKKRLKGSMQADKFYLSRFDGEDAVLIEGKVFESGEISGSLYVNKSIDILWSANK